ncbi:methylenetetrahydrofolate reductase [NAD(P)H] [Leptospira borgpetersenii]|uniref:Methylenetetrahydrofolate reductase n=2 Tax=Leptospira borgpetersenii serovar Hardjo-bovis TaxID=338217 RepID=Q04NW1_LEPBJ|nr:methylenetetrahydrofolate reductase [NAD(P)H] [Leptospira borgpetersenii]ABJ77409.1 5,10-methylenetetrahydrofolate reductase [Leptospira borgpetersenii serovar Hardjo-bovis str. JB197]ABJ80347.1 5,10-methylenetetrahydrofolate reductase [Leptospira borgpetersenii serovar Hardjo-bovis str. L550]AMX60036.1 5,10-methylenetetrahydrofolate reductase [Leptospira borgpetersenii serovar Hardjo]AMX63266.1 5,10-methylenetetrahydrofolate reductase [Leptospira borgpetersenii serovar Hardjo]AMX66510.1 5,
MKKVSEIYGSAKGPVYSFEFFPPKTQDGDLKLMGTVKELARLDPDFVTVTYGAGGSTRDKTAQILSEISKNYSFPTVSHFTCVGANQDQIFKTLKEIRSSGIVNLMALRGDPPKGEGKFKKTEGGFENATELISFIRSEKLDFCIGGGCYPEKHPNAKSLEEDVRNLKRKVDAGTDFLVSQLFFVNSIFENFLNLVRKADIRAPVIPGIMPITSFSQIERFRSIAGCEFPSSLIEDLQEVEHRPEEFYRRSLNFSIKQCRELLAMGVPGIHLYTLNQSHASYDIVRELKS